MRYRLRASDGFEVAVEDDRIIEAKGRFDLTLDLGIGELRAGLINAHDHLHRNHFPRLGRPPYRDSYEWGRDIHEKDAEVIGRARAVDRRDALLFGALKNLLAGVTTVVHHDVWEPAFETGFPIRVPRVRCIHSLHTEGHRIGVEANNPGAPLCMHLAEGTTSAMAQEVRRAVELGIVNEDLIAVHLVGVDPEGIELLARRGVTAAWCPTSNEHLFGRTAPQALLDRLDVVIGSDSLLTGAGTLLDELQHARGTCMLADQRLLDGVGPLAARKLRIPEPTLVPGAPADLVVLARHPLAATCEDVHLVIVGGVPRVADERYGALFELLGQTFERVRVGASSRLVSAPLGDVADRVRSSWPEVERIFATSTGATPPSS